MQRLALRQGALDVPFHKNSGAVRGLSEVDELGIEIDFSTFASGRIMGCWLRKVIGSTALIIRLRRGVCRWGGRLRFFTSSMVEASALSELRRC